MLEFAYARGCPAWPLGQVDRPPRPAGRASSVDPGAQPAGGLDEFSYPDGFDFTCECSEGIKFLRLFTEREVDSGGTTGSWDYYISAAGPVIATGVNQSEFYGNHPYPHEDIRGIGEPIGLGDWHAYEFHLKFSSVSGEGIIRAWQDGNLIFEDLETATLAMPSSVVTRATLWTYWNNNVRRTQSAYVDDVYITSDTPGDVDAAGNAFIGIGRPTPAGDAGAGGSDAGSDAGLPEGDGGPADGGAERLDAAIVSPVGPATMPDGCSCRVETQARSAPWALMFGFFGLWALRRRR